MPLQDLQIENRFTARFPADADSGSTPRQVHNALYSRVNPTPVSSPQTIAWSREMLLELGLLESDAESTEFAALFSGNSLLADMDPHASCYGGHQFGNWAGQLGDGRAINLGEVVGQSGQHWMLQLKGAGVTPYSRGADGRAVLRSSVREFLCSEAMFHLGVPTTRALSLVLTGDSVMRDMFYDGNPQAEPGAIVCRTAPSFTRFGHFEMLAARGEMDLLRELLDFTIEADFPDLLDSDVPPGTVYLRWFNRVCDLSIDMVVQWMRVGFVHGVMNTDNMSVLGLTIDYGPYGWVDDYDPGWTPNTTDAQMRRYCYGAQPEIVRWNLYQLANAILPLMDSPEPLKEVLSQYALRYANSWRRMMAEKLGLVEYQGESDHVLFEDLLSVLTLRETDMTIFFRNLANFDPSRDECDLGDCVATAFYDDTDASGSKRHAQALLTWEQSYRQRLLRDERDPEVRRREMNLVNPKYVLRNYLAQQAIDQAEQGDYSEISRLLEIMRHPYEEQPDFEAEYARKRPEWARHRPGSSQLSCSS